MNEKISIKRRLFCAAARCVLYTAAAAVCALLFGIVFYVLRRGLPYISLEFLTQKPSLLSETVGILPNILNTVYIIAITLAIVVPLGVGAAIYLSEYAASSRAAVVVEFATEALSGVPSVVYGLLGMLVFVRFFGLGTSLMAGGLTLVIMTFPIIIKTTRESLGSVPKELKEGAAALGAGKFYAIRTVVLPSAADGIVTGCVLAVGRIVGESAALLFTAGMSSEVMSFARALKPKSAGSTLSVALYMYAKERGEFEAAFAIAAILLILTFLINILARAVASALKKRRKQ